YQSAREFAEDLRRFLTHEPILARPVSRWEKVLRWARRRPAAAALTAVSALSAISLFILALILWQSAEREASALQRVTNLALDVDQLHQDRVRLGTEVEGAKQKTAYWQNKLLEGAKN